MEREAAAIVFLVTSLTGVWYWSFRELEKHSWLKPKARKIYASTAFPVLLSLCAVTMLLGTTYAPSVLKALGDIAENPMPFHIEALVIVPVFAVIPIVGFVAWWKVIKKIEQGMGGD